VEVVLSIIQKVGHFINCTENPLDQMGERFKPKISNTSSAIKSCIGTDKADDMNESSTTLPLPVEVQNNPCRDTSSAPRQACEHPFEALISLSQKSESWSKVYKAPLQKGKPIIGERINRQ